MFGRVQTILRQYASDNILRHGAIYFFFFGATTVVNIAFRKYSAVNLSIEDYGVFTALLAFFSILTQPFGALQMIITKQMSWQLGRNKPALAIGYFRWIFRIFVLLAVCGSVLILIFSPFLREQYQLPAWFSIFVVVLMFFLSSIGNCFAGALQAFQHFAVIGIINTLAVCAKLGACYILLHLFFGDIFPAPVAVNQSLLPLIRISAGFINRFDIPLLAVLFSIIFLVFANILFFRRDALAAGSAADAIPMEGRLASLLRDFLPIFILYLSFSLFRNIDEYMARRFLSEFDNGLYGALATVAKSSVFLVNAITFVTFPKFASHKDSVIAARRIMVKALILGALATLSFFALILLFPEFLLQALTHTKYMSAVSSLKYFFFAFMPYPMILIFINYFIVHHDWRYTISLAASIVCTIAAYELFHASVHEILFVLGVAGYTILAFSCIHWLRQIRRAA
ncbi:MAG: hypothetical protein LBC99_03165 [Spirochaetota bacterium]|jgi:O-antigen/teichoic acid export membrane protein|nr:hypothetical protein [Spirochaetota bacterium]